MEVIIKKSHRPDKKYDAIIDGKKTVSFGAKGYSDFTQHKDAERKQRYIDRHRRNENWDDPKTAGFYSRWLLWEKPTLTGSIKALNSNNKNLHVKLSSGR